MVRVPRRRLVVLLSSITHRSTSRGSFTGPRRHEIRDFLSVDLPARHLPPRAARVIWSSNYEVGLSFEKPLTPKLVREVMTGLAAPERQAH